MILSYKDSLNSLKKIEDRRWENERERERVDECMSVGVYGWI